VPSLGVLTDLDKKVLADLKEFPAKIGSSIEQYRLREATATLMDLARLGNKYLAETEPWKLAKTDMQQVGTILNIAIQISASLAIVCEPFLPFTSAKLKKMLAISEVLDWQQAGRYDLLKVGHGFGEPELLFEKIEDDVIAKQLQKLNDSKKAIELANQPADPAKAEISFDDFQKMDIRIGTILKAERVEKSKKLLKLQVDTGIDKRTVMSGIAEHFSPEEIVGKQVTILVNLAPRKIMGVESQGMILMAADKDGKLRLLQPNEVVSAGSTVS
jgi:methionyl-tRNA synthetase